MTQIIEPLNKYDSKKLNLYWTFFFKVWLKELNFWIMTQKNWIFFFLKYESKRIVFFSEIWLKKNWIFFSEIMTLENWIFFSNMTQENWTFLFWIWFKRIEPFCCFEYDSKNGTFVSITQSFSYLIQRIFLKNKTTQRIEIFLQHMTQRIDLFFFWTYVQKLILVSMIHRIEPSLHDSKNWTFFFLKIWLRELNLL